MPPTSASYSAFAHSRPGGQDGISHKMLTQHLRELEHHGLITRTVHPVVPSHVDNALTAQGLTTLPITRIAARVECVVSDEASAPRALVPPRSFISNTLAAGG